MATSPLPDLYQRYKTGTRHVVQWLANTTRQCCADDSILPDVSLGNPARKRDEKAPAVISAGDLVRLARRLFQQSTPARPAPSGINSAISILTNVIAGRRECGAWYKGCSTDASGEKQDKDASHQHFINALSEVLDHLKQTLSNSKRPAQGSERPHGSAADPIGDALTNAFSALLVEEPSASFQNQPKGKKKKTRGPAKATKLAVAFELEVGQDDVFALWCFLKGCHEIRTFVRTTWEEYYRRNLELLTATQLTDVAFNLIRQAAEEFARHFPELGDFNRVADRFNVRITASGETIEAFDCDTAGLHMTTASVVEARELLCAPAWSVANILRRILIGFEDRSLEFFDASSHIKAGHLLGEVIFHAIDELQKLRVDPARLEDINGGDTFMRMTMEFLANSSTLHLDFVVAVQIYMDIYDALGRSTTRLVRVYNHIRAACVESARLSLANFRTTAIALPEASKYGEKFADFPQSKGIERSLSKAFGAPMRDWECPMSAEECDEITQSTRKTLMYFPVMSGYLATVHMQRKQETGLRVCNFGAVVHATAHLYKACRDAGLLSTRWQDMDFVILQQGAKRLGLRTSGDTTKLVLTAAKNYGMALGVELRDYVRLRLRSQNGATHRIALPEYSVVMMKLERMQRTSAYAIAVGECTASYRSLGPASSDAASASCAALHQFARKVLADPTSEVEETLRRQWDQSRDLRPVQLLSLLRTHLSAQQDSIAFDYHKFFTRCATLLYTLRADVESEVRRLRLSRGLGRDYMLYELVDEILWQTADAESLGHRVSGPNTLLGQVAGGMNKYIAAMGGSCLGCARTWSHDQLPSNMRADMPTNATRRADAVGMKLALRGNDATLTTPAASDGKASYQARVLQDIVEYDQMIKRGATVQELAATAAKRLAEIEAMKRDLLESGRQKPVHAD
ncbi:hypothetical protein LTR36_010106 [Oleoguttula mirabilis]|uniref:DUF6604 domain-containing protein n=1 Tax=Oleoguttula mirabilis TaxID=1507867 RepID=A0AAV9JRH0_9PEZI|nr:hypothetical protein LTR36_010106 [Oleoguttula mirabilis]